MFIQTIRKERILLKKITVTLFAMAIGMMVFAVNGPAEELFDTCLENRVVFINGKFEGIVVKF